jgi:hypothetical protein
MMDAEKRSQPTKRPQAPAAPGLSRDAALQRVRAFKKYLTIMAVLGFAAVGGLAATHTKGAPGALSSGVSQGSAVSGSAQPNAAAAQPQGGFFNQSQGGFSFGNGFSTQPPVAGSGAS